MQHEMAIWTKITSYELVYLRVIV